MRAVAAPWLVRFEQMVDELIECVAVTPGK